MRVSHSCPMAHHGTCRLCLAEADLIDSHIIPAWAWRRVHEKTLKNPNPVVVTDGMALQSGVQIHEHLFCRPCENRFKVGEDYASRVTYQRDHTSPFLDLVGNVVGEHERLRVAHTGRLDVAKLLHFGVGVVWRASICREIEGCKFTAEHEESLRRYLLGETPLPNDVACCLVFHDLPHEDSHIANVFFTPVSDDDGLHRFLLFGLQYWIASGDNAAVFREFCLSDAGASWICLAPQEDLIDYIGPFMMSARRSKSVNDLPVRLRERKVNPPGSP